MGASSVVTSAVLHEELSRGDSGICTAFNVTAWSWFPALVSGNKTVLDTFAPMFCGNELKLGCFAMTEPGGLHGGGGCDIENPSLYGKKIRTMAKLDGDEWVINGQKMWTSNSSVADLYCVLCTTDPELGEEGIALIYVPADAEGLSFGKWEQKAGMEADVNAAPNPHIPERVHPDNDEIVMHIGSDPHNPEDLGAEIEYVVGEETLIINKTSAIFIPKGMKHGSLTWKSFSRPHIQMTIMLGAGILAEAAPAGAQVMLMQEAIPHMIKEGGGSIINVASLGGLRCLPGFPAYCASKAGLIMLTQQAALDYGAYNIRCNAVCPGGIKTEITEEAFGQFGKMPGMKPEAYLDLIAEDMPLKRFGEPHEIGGVCTFLASDDSSFMTGAALVIDAGTAVVDVVGASITGSLRRGGL